MQIKSKSVVKKRHWSNEDFYRMQLLFSFGCTIREIAETLDRTPTAVNKALSRFGIRVKKEIDQKPDNCIDKNKIWVTISDVIEYAQMTKINLECNMENTYILIAVNKRRFDQKLPIFCVENLTW